MSHVVGVTPPLPAPAHASPHAASAAAVVARLGSDPQRGLDVDEAAERLATTGPNRLPAAERPAYGAIAARQLLDPLVALLVSAAVVSAAIGEVLEAGVIAAIVVLDAVLGFAQDVAAERAVLALRGSVVHTASVIRDGQEREVPADEVVPGDLVVVREGDRVPADARLVSAELLEVDESALTGESMPVAKSIEAVAGGTPLAERVGLVFAGTAVTRGRARAVVTATGGRTEIGAIASLTAVAKPPPTPLQRRLARLSGGMAALGVGITLMLATGMLLRDASLEEAFLVGVAVAVAAVPEGLAATVTIALAQGARTMAAQGAIVTRLDAVETIGAATVVAADKTGTLTINRLRVADVLPAPGRRAVEVIEAGVLASTAELLESDDGTRIAGDPVDGAFLLAATDTGAPDPRTATDRSLVREVPFDPLRRRQTAVYRERWRLRVVVKGAPETLLERSRLGPHERRKYAGLAEEWAAQGLRVLAVGERWPAGATASPAELDDDLELIGLVGLRDPLRPAAADSVLRARDAGIEVVMLTGDHPVTAAATGRALDLDGGAPVTGPMLAAMDDTALHEAVTTRQVFARVTPSDKLRLVEALQDAGHVVAVTGDGINDTPALRRADVGVAMGSSGTEAAREAADLVLTDDDFTTIVRAIHEGRRIDENVRKFVAFLLSANLGEVVLFGIAVLGGLGAPMTVVQVLVVNLLTDGLPAIALSRDPASPDAMHRPPRGRDRLFSTELRFALVIAGLAVGVAATCSYALGRQLAPGEARTMAFATIALAELAFVYSIRSSKAPAWRGPANRALGWSVLGSVLLVALAVYLPVLNGLLGTRPLAAAELAIVAGLALTPAVLLEGLKAIRRRRVSPRRPGHCG